MTERRPASEPDTRDDFVADAEIARRWGVSAKTARVAIRAFEVSGRRTYRPFPRRDPLLGNKRYWPAVKAYMDRRAGLIMHGPEASDGEEHHAQTPEDRRRARAGVAGAH